MVYNPDDHELLGYAVYTGDESVENWMECLDCHDPDAIASAYQTAEYRDLEFYGNETPYLECAVCGEVMRPAGGE